MQACGKKGRFLELGRRGIWTSDEVKRIRPDINYVMIEIDEKFLLDPKWVQETLINISNKFHEGKWKPIPITQFSLAEIVEAARFMQKAKQIGKIVINIEKNIS